MNEQEILRQQVSTERRHMSAVKNACEAAIAARLDEETLDRFCRSCVGYLIYVLRRFNAQDQKHADLLRPRLTAEEAGFVPVLEDLNATLATHRSALERLAQALDGRHSGTISHDSFLLEINTYIEYFNNILRHRQHRIGPLLERHYTIGDWRAASFVTADSILEERERYAVVQSQVPAGIELKSSGRPA